MVLGTGRPGSLAPQPAGGDGPADLVVVAPGREELSRRALARLAGEARDGLAPNGIAYLLAPGLRGLALSATARSRGLETGPAFLHWPDAGSSRYVVAATRAPMAYAGEAIVAARSWRGRLARPLARAPGGAKALAAARLSGVVARHPGAEPQLAWLGELAGEPIDASAVVVARTWRDEGAAFVVLVVDRDRRGPRIVAKVGSGPASAAPELGEERALAALGDAARAAGADVPRVVASGALAGAPVVVESGIQGRAAAVELADRPERAAAVLARLADWLEGFGRGTRVEHPAAWGELERELTARAETLAPGTGYAAWLDGRYGEARSAGAPLTAAHDDLTMVNVLLGERGRIGIVDWDTARVHTLPLVDFFYAAVDAYAAAGRYADRLGAFLDCFGPAGRATAAVTSLEERLVRALDVPAPVRDLAFHACWLHHAANERARGAEGEFGAIVRELSRDASRFSRLRD